MTTTRCVRPPESARTPTTGWASVVSCMGRDLWSSVMPQDPVPSGSGRPSSGLDNFAGQAGGGPEGALASAVARYERALHDRECPERDRGRLLDDLAEIAAARRAMFGALHALRGRRPRWPCQRGG